MTRLRRSVGALVVAVMVALVAVMLLPIGTAPGGLAIPAVAAFELPAVTVADPGGGVLLAATLPEASALSTTNMGAFTNDLAASSSASTLPVVGGTISFIGTVVNSTANAVSPAMIMTLALSALLAASSVLYIGSVASRRALSGASQAL